MPKHKEVKVRLTKGDRNVFAVITACKRAALEAGIPKEEVNKFVERTMSAHDYDEVLRICMEE